MSRTVHDPGPRGARPFWWQWPTVLSLDAPAVALVWQWEFARVTRSGLRPEHRVLLGTAAWLVYAADRWIEGWQLDPGQIRTHRHRFYQVSRWPVAALWIVVLAAGLAIAAASLSLRQIAAGLVLAAPVLVYLLSHQVIHRHSRWRAPKEVCIGILFAAGVALFPAAAPGADLRPLAAPLVLFALLCFSNCALISVWESGVDLSHGQTSLALGFRRGRAFSKALPWVLGCAGAGLWLNAAGADRTAEGCLASSGILFGLIDRLEARIGREAARVLVDAALLTPIVPMAAHWFAR